MVNYFFSCENALHYIFLQFCSSIFFGVMSETNLLVIKSPTFDWWFKQWYSNIYILILHWNFKKIPQLIQSLNNILFKVPLNDSTSPLCVGLAYTRTRVRDTVGAASRAFCSQHLHRAIRGAQGVPLCRVGGNVQSIGSTVSDAIVRSWLWSTATGSAPH